MADTTITGLPQTLTIDAATVVPADYNAGTYKVTMTTLGSFITTNATTVSATGNITGGNLKNYSTKYLNMCFNTLNRNKKFRQSLHYCPEHLMFLELGHFFVWLLVEALVYLA